MHKKQIVHALIVLAAVIAVVRFHSQIAGLLAKVPVVNKLAGVA